MKDKLIALALKVKPALQKLVSAAPFLVGVSIGYVFKPEIQFVVKGLLSLIGLIIKI